ncbi:hypothetical protein PTE31013_03958 [Pandoraea terrigena]|uniref:Uncharacterized protein n=1 Tax=Pandoraea terrigena TaxID=2508292 RepID=A0A5E4XJQ9_9BURK|nr:hypothetical protein PTE31013_03958 [Pandoraea terrigena]
MPDLAGQNLDYRGRKIVTGVKLLLEAPYLLYIDTSISSTNV